MRLLDIRNVFFVFAEGVGYPIPYERPRRVPLNYKIKNVYLLAKQCILCRLNPNSIGVKYSLIV